MTWLICQLLFMSGLLFSVWVTAQTLDEPLAPSRIIQLPIWENAHQWARDRQLVRWRVLPGTGGDQYLVTQLNESDWKALQPSCMGDVRCFSDSCQRIRQDITDETWLLSAAPDLALSLAGKSPACPEVLSPSEGAYPDLLPPGCWLLQRGTGCEVSLTPGQYLTPEVRKGHFLALVPNGAQGREALLKTRGVELLESFPLQSLDAELMRLYQPDHSQIPSLLEQLGGLYPSLLLQAEHAYAPMVRWSSDSGRPSIQTTSLQSVNAGLTIALIGTGTSASADKAAGSRLQKIDVTGQGHQAALLGDTQLQLIAHALSDSPIHNYQICSQAEWQPGGVSCWSSSLIKALDRAIVSDASVIQIGVGGSASEITRRLLREAQRRQKLVLSGAGDGGALAPPVYPAAWPEVMAITAADVQGRLYKQANRGSYVALAAPGVNWPLARDQGASRFVSGTALASTYVGAIVAQLTTVNPGVTVRQVFDRLLEQGRDAGPKGVDSYFGAGLLEWCGMLVNLEPGPLVCSSAWEARD